MRYGLRSATTEELHDLYAQAESLYAVGAYEQAYDLFKRIQREAYSGSFTAEQRAAVDRAVAMADERSQPARTTRYLIIGGVSVAVLATFWLVWRA